MERFYFSAAAADKLSGVLSGVLTMVEAPAGYGKTTAVRWALREVPQEQIHWFTAVSLLQDTSLDWFIRQLGRLDAAAGAAFRGLGFLNRSNVGEAAELLAGLHVEERCYLILDNFQRIGDNWPLPLLQAMADRRRDGLHVILISQNFGRLRAAVEDAGGLVRITSRDLLLKREDVEAYGRQLGLALTEAQLDAVCRSTEGWAAAVSLYLEHLSREGGALPDFQDMDALLEEFFWRRLTGEERELLLRTAVFDCIRWEELPRIAPGRAEALSSLLFRSPLMNYDIRERACYPHELLRHFLLRMLAEAPAALYREIYETAGELYGGAGRQKRAVECFFLAGSDEKLLDCALTGLLGESFGSISYPALARTVLDRCSDAVLAAHPLSALRLCLALFAGADFQGFRQALERSRRLLEAGGDETMMGGGIWRPLWGSFPTFPG